MNSRMLSHHAPVPELISSMSEFDLVGLPQHADQWQSNSGRQPEKSLMLVVLLDAVEGFQKYALLQDEYSDLIFRDTEYWIFEDNQEWPFLNFCQSLIAKEKSSGV